MNAAEHAADALISFEEHAMNMAAREVWVPVSGYEGLYSISNLGNLRSEEKKVFRRNGIVCNQPQQLMHPSSGKSKYLTVRLKGTDGAYLTHYVHTLVLENFVSPRPDGMEACHCDGNRQNNAATNLRWDTRSGNHKDKNLHGTGTVGESHPGAKLSDELVRKMRSMRADGLTVRQIARDFSVSVMTASRAISGKSWSHIK